jgi:hypothetical protein
VALGIQLTVAKSEPLWKDCNTGGDSVARSSIIDAEMLPRICVDKLMFDAGVESVEAMIAVSSWILKAALLILPPKLGRKCPLFAIPSEHVLH